MKLGQENLVSKDLGYAEQRFDSFSKPLRRMVTHFHESVYTAHIIIRKRRKNTREHQAFEPLDVAGMLQLGLFADACACVDARRPSLRSDQHWTDLPFAGNLPCLYQPAWCPAAGKTWPW